MNEDEIKRYMAKIKGDQGNKSDDDIEHSGTKTRITGRGEINHDDIEFDLNNPINHDKTHLEYDENDLPLSIKSDAIIGKKNNKADYLDVSTPKHLETRNTFRAKDDEELNQKQKSIVNRKPKVRGTKAGFDDSSLKLGSVDDLSESNDSSLFKKQKAAHDRRNSTTSNQFSRKNSLA